MAISIVAVLATIGFSLFQSTQATARDAKRRADVDAMASALEVHFDATTGLYTAIDDTVAATWFSDKVIPKDPLNDAASGYVYSYPTTAAAAYTVCAKLENKGGNFSDQGITPATGSNAVNYCKLSQQQ